MIVKEYKMDIWFGWTEIYIDNDGMPASKVTSFKASAFVLFTHVIYIGEVKRA